MKKVNVVGLGPGSPEYVTPAAVKVLAESDIIIGGSRNLSSLDHIKTLNTAGIEKYDLTGRLDETRKLILSSLHHKRITVAASGDPGFYGILGFLKKFLTADQLNVIPGISSVQYMFARLGMTWESAAMGSLHGRDANIASLVSQGCAAFLTDNKVAVSFLAKNLCHSGFSERKMYAGCSLSYPDEIIHSGTVKDFITKDIDNTLCVVVIADE